MDEYGQDTTLSGDASSNSDILSALFSGAASVANTAIIANANPVNAAILTNTPLATPSTTVGYGAGATMTSSSTFLLVALVVGGALLFVSMKK